MKLKDIDNWLEMTKSAKDVEYDKAIIESETLENLENIEELDEENDI